MKEVIIPNVLSVIGLLVVGAIAAGILPEDYLAGSFFVAGCFQQKVSELVKNKLAKKGE